MRMTWEEHVVHRRLTHPEVLMRVRAVSCSLVVLFFLPNFTSAQTPDQVAGVANALEWREVGPTIMGGRVSDLAVVESDPSVFYVGTATAGIWKTENAGTTFTPVFEHEVTSSIGDVTVAPSNANTELDPARA